MNSIEIIYYSELVEFILQNEMNLLSIKDKQTSKVLKLTYKGKDLIVKLWDKKSYTPFLRYWRWRARREYRLLNLLHQKGCSVPEPYHFQKIKSKSRFYDVLIMEDLGNCETLTQKINAILKTGNMDQLDKIEEDLIQLTKILLNSGVCDPDHSPHNMLYTNEGRIYRLDFEQAFIVKDGFAAKFSGRTLGRLISMYTIAVQPHVGRVIPFSERLIHSTGVSKATLPVISKELQKLLDFQRKHDNIDTRLTLPW